MLIIVAGKDDLARAQFLAYQDTKSLVNLVSVDERCCPANRATCILRCFSPSTRFYSISD